jgi:hypothetical protein
VVSLCIQGEGQLAFVGVDDRESAGQPAGATGLGLVLEGEEMPFRTIRPEHRWKDPRSEACRLQGVIKGGDLAECVGVSGVDGAQPDVPW